MGVSSYMYGCGSYISDAVGNGKGYGSDSEEGDDGDHDLTDEDNKEQQHMQ